MPQPRGYLALIFPQVDSVLGRRKKKMSRQNYVSKTSDAQNVYPTRETADNALRESGSELGVGGWDGYEFLERFA